MGAVSAALGGSHVPQADGTKVEFWNKQCGYAAAAAAAAAAEPATAAAPAPAAAPEPMQALSANKRSEAAADLDGPPSPDRAAGGDPNDARFAEWKNGKQFCKSDADA